MSVFKSVPKKKRKLTKLQAEASGDPRSHE